jgi:hypothetical protein
MSPSAQLTLEQLKEIIEDEKKNNASAREDQKQVEDGEEVLNPHNTSLVLSTVINTFNNQFEYEFLDEAVRLLKAHPSHQSTDDRVPGHNYSIPGMLGTEFLAHHVGTIWYTVMRGVWVAEIPGVLS